MQIHKLFVQTQASEILNLLLIFLLNLKLIIITFLCKIFKHTSHKILILYLFLVASIILSGHYELNLVSYTDNQPDKRN